MRDTSSAIAFVREPPGRVRNAACPCGTGEPHKVKRCPKITDLRRDAEAQNVARNRRIEERALAEAMTLANTVATPRPR